MITKINLTEKANLLNGAWNPAILAELNGQEVKLATFKGEFTWHSHAETDELFYVLDGSFELQLRTQTIPVEKGEMVVVPKGTEHRPVANNGEAIVLLFEQKGTLNTGDNPGELSVQNPQKI